MEETWGNEVNTNSEGSTAIKESVSAFKSDLEESFSRLGAAAGRVLEISGTLDAAANRFDAALEIHRQLEGQSRAAADDARGMLAEMRDLLDQARAARDRSLETQESMTAIFGDITDLTADLRERIAALAVLGRPLMALESPASDFDEPGLTQDDLVEAFR